jgi:hypothetical protein
MTKAHALILLLPLALLASSVEATAPAATAEQAAAAAGTYTMGARYPKLPAGCIEPKVQGVAYYLCGNTWFQPTYGANGVYYKVVAAP